MEDADAGGTYGYEETSTAMAPLPLYSVNVTEAIKQGESVMFTISVENEHDDSQSSKVVAREYDDLEWLNHNLITGNCIDGVIAPPLPVRPLTDPKSAEMISKKQLGDNSKVLRGDQFEVDCKAVQRYLELLLRHSTFGRDNALIKFLTEEQAPTRAKLSKGLMDRLSSVIGSAMKSGTKDLDEFFSQQRQFAFDYQRAVKEASLNFTKLLVAQWRLSSSYRNLTTELMSCTAERDESLIKLNRILKVLSDGMEDEAANLELRSGQGELTLAFYFDLFSRYSDSFKNMLTRRTLAMNEYTSSEKAMEKAKPIKRAAAEEAFEAAKVVYERCTEQGRKEINLFTQLRLLSSADVLTNFAELQIQISQDFYNQLFLTKKSLLELQL